MRLRHWCRFCIKGRRVSRRLVAIATLGYVHIRMFSDSIVQTLTDLSISNTRKQPSRYFLGKPLFLFVWITDRHIQNRLLKAFVLLVRMSLYQKCHPSLKPYGSKTGDIGPFVVAVLDEMVLTTELSVQSRD